MSLVSSKLLKQASIIFAHSLVGRVVVGFLAAAGIWLYALITKPASAPIIDIAAVPTALLYAIAWLGLLIGTYHGVKRVQKDIDPTQVALMPWLVSVPYLGFLLWGLLSFTLSTFLFDAGTLVVCLAAARYFLGRLK